MFVDSLTMPYKSVERQAGNRDRGSSDDVRLAPVLGATSTRRQTADTARGLLVTLLGEYVLPLGGSVWTQTLLAGMETVGIQPKTSRQAIARLADRGWLDRTRDGRRTRWHLTPFATDLLRSGAERIYGFGLNRPGWDGRWLVVMASLPESVQHQRYRMTRGLTWAGFGSLGHGIWISPWVHQESAAVTALHDLEISDATTFVAEIGRLGQGDELAARAWDLDALRGAYRDFIKMTEHTDVETAGAAHPSTSDRSHGDGSHDVAELTTLVHRWRRFPFLDPELPPELLPEDWPAQSAIERFGTRRAELLDSARAWWATLDVSVEAPATA